MATDKKISELPVSASVAGGDVSILVKDGINYQFSVNQLLSYLNTSLSIGAALTFGIVLPQNITGKNGDVFFNTTNRQFAQKLAGSWVVAYTLPETNAADGTLLYGAGLPGSNIGKNADSYINTLTGIFYLKSNGSWAQVFSMQTGPQGPKGTTGDAGPTGSNGRTILNGTGNPSNLSTGTDGDFYINTTALSLFGPKTNGIWGDGVSIVGEDGAQGEAGPAGAQGAVGPIGPRGLVGPQGLQGLVGPAGSVGPQGLVGPQGPAGANGAGGSGGTMGSAYILRPFDQTLNFDANFKMQFNQTDNITFALGISPVADVIARVSILGDGVHTCTFPNNWINANGQVFDNRYKNVFFFEYDGDEVFYSIVKAIIPDIIPPLLISATINNSAKNKIVLTYNELLDELSVPSINSFVANLGKAISTVDVSGAIITLTVASTYAYGDNPIISYTPGGNKIQDTAGNPAAALVDIAIVNNVVEAKQSAYITVSNQIQQTSVLPSALAWGGGGSDRPWSLSGWFKRNNNNSDYLVELLSDSNPSSPNLGISLRTDGSFNWYIYNSGVLNKTTPAGAVSSNTWTHVDFVYDGSGLASGMKIYVNKSLQALNDTSSGSYNRITTLLPDFQLAVFGRAFSSGSNPGMNIKISGLYFWNKELSISDISEIYNNGKSVDPTVLSMASSLVSRYEFDGNTNDLGPYGYNLTGVNPPTYSFETP